MIYLASPYTANLVGEAKEQLEMKRYLEALKFTMLITSQGVPLFSPIVYYHPIAKPLKMSVDAETWEAINHSYLRRAEAVFVLRLPGWDQSKGVQKETKLAKALFIPIVHYGADFKPIEGQDIDIIVKQGMPK